MDSLFVDNRMVASKSINPANFLQSSFESNILPKIPFRSDSREKEIKELMNITLSDDEFKNISLNCSMVQNVDTIQNFFMICWFLDLTPSKFSEIKYCVLMILLRMQTSVKTQNHWKQELLPRIISNQDFLFIDGTFYNDHRDPENIDYSECIREWAKSKKNIDPFKTAVMEDTTFDQLNIRLGYPQVYQHLGNCEHLFTFSDMEILQPSDSCVYTNYPIYKSISIRKARYCCMCGSYVAKWKVEGNERIPFDPAFFCDGCFTSYNYIDGVKIGNFKAYLYIDTVVAM